MRNISVFDAEAEEKENESEISFRLASYTIILVTCTLEKKCTSHPKLCTGLLRPVFILDLAKKKVRSQVPGAKRSPERKSN